MFGTQTRSVQNSPELRRILALPRRQWTEEQTQEAVRTLTRRFKTFNGTQTLRPIQARAIWEAIHLGALVGPIRVGGGKTLILFLIFRALGAKRPVLVVPGGLLEKTERDFREYAKHWDLGPMPLLMSYEKISNVRSEAFLIGPNGTGYHPDAMGFDEVHKLKNKKAACTRRIARLVSQLPETRLFILSGTLLGASLLDAAHLLTWTLKGNAPVPATSHEAAEWAGALDPKSREPLGTGALSLLAIPGDTGNLQEVARRGFRDRLHATPGVVGSEDQGVACSILIRPLEYEPEDSTFANLRSSWKLPDGYGLTMATQAWAAARQLALDLHYFWDPRAPFEWLRARGDWAAYVREVLKESRTLDSEEAVKVALEKGRLKDDFGLQLLRTWETIRPTFLINSKLAWHGSAAIDACREWAKEPGIIWTEHSLFAEELSVRAGIPYYGSKGIDKRTGAFIESEKGDRAVIASVAANATGRNLQYAFSRNLLTAPTSSATTLEQLIGRTHRDGQEADEVIVDVLFGCYEHWDAIRRAVAKARFIRDMLGQEQKILLADLDWPSSLAGRKGFRWAKNEDLGNTEE